MTTLTGASTLHAPTITAMGTIDGPQNLVLHSSNATFMAPVGATTRLGDVVGEGSITTKDFFASRFSYTGTGNLTFGGAGLDVAGILNIGEPGVMPQSIVGSLTSTGAADLRALTINAAVLVPELTIGARTSNLTGMVGGMRGRLAARAIRFSTLQGGPQIFGSYAIPMSDDYRAPQSFVGTVPALLLPVDALEEGVKASVVKVDAQPAQAI